MTSEKGIQDYKTVLRSVLKAELQLLLRRLSENGEESLVLTATTGGPQRFSTVWSKLGGEFFKKESACLQEIGNKFQSYCQGHRVSQPHIVKDSNSNKKRKLSSSEDEEAQNYSEMEEVIVYVTEADGGSSEAVQKGNDVSSSGSTLMAGSGSIPVYSEAFSEHLPQINIPSQSDAEAKADSNSEVATEVVIIAEHNDDQSKTLWLDYMPSNSDGANSTGDQETVVTTVTPDQSQEAMKTSDSEHNVSTTVDVAGSQYVRQTFSQSVDGLRMKAPHVYYSQGSGAEKSQDSLQTAVSDSIGADSGRVLVRNEATNRYMAVPVSLLSTSASPPKRGFSQTTKLGHTKQSSSPSVEKKPLPSPYSTYLSRMSTGKSIMIRAGEDSFEEIQTICIPESDESTGKSETKPERKRESSSKKSVKKEASPVPGAVIETSGEPETIVTESGETVHVLKTATEEQEETFDIPFEDCFDLLGKSARCLVCGKIMLKRNRRYHWRFHTGQKPYTCEYCQKQFYHPSNLKTHKFIHEARNR